MKFTLGADPEVFLADAAESLVSVIDKIGGTKLDPLPLPIGDGFAVQEDNVAVEFNVPPANSSEEMQNNITKAMLFLQDFFKREHGLKFINLSAGSFPVGQLSDPRALVFGCDPDYNAWTNKQNTSPRAEDASLRSAGGHVHVGIDVHKPIKRNIVKAMDLYHGVPSVFMDHGELRKQLYGKAGAHRIKPYGVEYRTLSNYWIFDKKLIDWVYRQTEKAVDHALTDITDINNDADLIIGAINNNDKGIADFLINKYNLELCMPH